MSYWFTGLLPQELTSAFKRRVTAELKQQLKGELLVEIKQELGVELENKLRLEMSSRLAPAIQRQIQFLSIVERFLLQTGELLLAAQDEREKFDTIENLSRQWRQQVRRAAGLSPTVEGVPRLDDEMKEIAFLQANAGMLRPVFEALATKRVLYSGQAYYNVWYLSRALRPLGWKADVLNWDANLSNQIYYHGEDFRVGYGALSSSTECLEFYVSALYGYDVFHFSNAHGISFGDDVQGIFASYFGPRTEIGILKSLGKKIVYSNNGCLDGVSQTAFAKWGPESVCKICIWKDQPAICSDEKNLAWGEFRNSVADYQCTLGGNRADFNDDPRVHEVPEFYCLDPDLWHPRLEIPIAHRLPFVEGSVRLYHAVGHKTTRTTEQGINIKSSHVYLPLIQRLVAEGLALELIEPTGIPNKEVRYLQAQADIFLDMLTFGWFGANAREAMMLGKPVICYIRPEWLESVREEVPGYADELPVISATPLTVENILRDLIADPQKRKLVGERSREFAVKWHSADAAGRRFDKIYDGLLHGDPLLRVAGPRVLP